MAVRGVVFDAVGTLWDLDRRTGRTIPCPGAEAAVAAVRRVLPVGLVSDGAPRPDGPLASGFDFELAGPGIGIGPGDPRRFTMAAAGFGCHPNELLFVGADPRIEITAAQAVGARAVWVDRAIDALPRGVHPDAVIGDLGDLSRVLERFRADDDARAGIVGVGPHPEPWPEDPRLDPVLLRTGDRRNVVDRYRYWREDAVVADLAARAHPVHLAVENWRQDRNLGTVVRNANGFGAAGVHMLGRRRWNRRGAMATDRYTPVHHHPTIEQFLEVVVAEDLAIVAIDNLPGAVPLETAELPERAVLVLGQEGPGLSPELRDRASVLCEITQYGSTRSLNAGVASGIALYAWALQHGRRP